MSLIKIIKFRKNLTDKQKEFLESKQLKGNFTSQKLLKTLSKTAKYDQLNDKARKRSILIMVLSLILGIFLSLVIQNPIPFILGLAIFISLLVYYQKLQSSDLDNSFRLFTMPLIGIFREEVKPNSKMTIALNCKNPYAKENCYNVKPRTENLGRTISYFKFHWLSLKAEIIDGSRISLENTDFLQKIDIKKRGASGKIKFKTKYKKTSLIKLVAEFPKDKFQVKENQEYPFRIENLGDNIIVKAKFKLKTPGKEATMPLNIYLKNIQQVYSLVKPLASN